MTLGQPVPSCAVSYGGSTVARGIVLQVLISKGRVAGKLAAVTGPFRWLAQHPALCLILFSSFAARLFLADWN